MPTLQGYYFFQGSTDKDADMAAKYFERTTQIDPSYALAWAWLSRARNCQANEGLIPMEEGRRLAREAVEQGRPQGALPEVDRVHCAPLRAFLYALTYHALGQEKESDAALNELITKYHASNASEIAMVYAFRDQTDKAFE